MHELTKNQDVGVWLPFAEALERLRGGDSGRDVLKACLLARNGDQSQLFALARERREERFPRRCVEVRSVVELSNICCQHCTYCSIGGDDCPPYTLGEDELTKLADHVYQNGRRVLFLQSGENPSQEFVDLVARSVEQILGRHPDLVIVLCLGKLAPEQYQQLWDAGAKRYILKFETSNPELFARMKPRDSLDKRLACMEDLLRIGYQVGSGNIVGLPGQTLEDLLDDMELLGRYDLAMNSASVFIPGETTPLRDEPPGDVDLTLNSMALMRILHPGRLIPTTSSLDRYREDGQWLGLMAGANTVTIHDGTPEEYKEFFPIYSARRYAPQWDHFADIVKRAGLSMSMEALL